MRNFTLKALILLAGVFSAASAFAQSRVITANVPFAFSVENKVLPAGRYDIKQVGGQQFPSTVLIRNHDHPEYAVLTVTEANLSQLPNMKTTNARLVFDNYGGHYFLREVRGPEDVINAQFFVKKSEKAAQRRSEASRRTQTAVNAGQ